MATDDVQVRRETVIGFRAWHVVNGDLVSLSSGTRWPHFERMAAMHNGEHADHVEEAPCSDKLHCGIYAYRSPSELVRLSPQTGEYAWGEVSLWGRLIRHEFAWRAQFAYPRFVVVRNELDAELVRRNYGCEVIVDNRRAPAPPEPVVAGAPAPGVVPSVGAQHPTIPYSLLLLAQQHKTPGQVGAPVPCVNLYVRNQMGQQWAYNGVADTHAISEWLGGIMEFLIADGFAFGAGGQSQVMWNVAGYFH